jgi:hypothetical protein
MAPPYDAAPVQDPASSETVGDPFVAGFLAWLVPGAGYLYLGRRHKGLMLGGAVLGVFLLGLVLGGAGTVSWEREPIWFAGQVFAGLPALAAAVLGLSAGPIAPGSAYELGVLYTCIAALCNFLCVLDSASTATKPLTPADAPAAPSPVAAATPEEPAA